MHAGVSTCFLNGVSEDRKETYFMYRSFRFRLGEIRSEDTLTQRFYLGDIHDTRPRYWNQAMGVSIEFSL